MANTVVVLAYAGSRGVSMVGQRDVNPPLPSGARTLYFNTGAIALEKTITVDDPKFYTRPWVPSIKLVSGCNLRVWRFPSRNAYRQRRPNITVCSATPLLA
jgi:hypothetical protein